MLKSKPLEDALDVAITLKDLAIRGVIHPRGVDKLDFPNRMKKAYGELLTLYDASYIILPRTRKLS